MQIRLLIPSLLCLASVWMVAAGCASSSWKEKRALADIQERHQADQAAFDREQHWLASSEEFPVILDYGDLGEIEVESVELVGWPQAAVLRADFTWTNTRAGIRRAPVARLSIIDEVGDDWRSGSVGLGSAMGIHYGVGTTHSTWLRVHTDGLHLRPGWTWNLELLDRDSSQGSQSLR